MLLLSDIKLLLLFNGVSFGGDTHDFYILERGLRDALEFQVTQVHFIKLSFLIKGMSLLLRLGLYHFYFLIVTLSLSLQRRCFYLLLLVQLLLQSLIPALQ